MADEILSSGTEELSDVSTVPANTTFADAADALEPTDATSETDGTTETDDAGDPKKLRDQVAGFKGTVSQQAKELKELKAKMASLEKTANEAATARAELERLRQDQASAVQRNQAQVEIQTRVEAAVADYARNLDLRGVLVDDDTRAYMLGEYRKAELRAEVERYEKENRDTQLNETAKQRQAREYREQAIAARDKVVSREAAKLTKQLKAVGIDRPITADEIKALLQKDVTANDALDELQDVSETVYEAAVAEARKAARKAGIAERDANGVDQFERGGTSTLSPQTILDRWSEGSPEITYAMAKAAEKALARR